MFTTVTHEICELQFYSHQTVSFIFCVVDAIPQSVYSLVLALVLRAKLLHKVYNEALVRSAHERDDITFRCEDERGVIGGSTTRASPRGRR